MPCLIAIAKAILIQFVHGNGTFTLFLESLRLYAVSRLSNLELRYRSFSRDVITF